MFLDFLLRLFEEHKHRDAVIWRDKVYPYHWLLHRIDHWKQVLIAQDIPPGTISILEGDFSPNSIALFLALVERRCILVPLTKSVQSRKAEFILTAQGEARFSLTEDDDVEIARLPGPGAHALYRTLRQARHPGLVLFSSGSTGKSKAAVHDLVPILEKFQLRRPAFRTITFLLYDHIGGINTMLHTLSNGGSIIAVADRSPDGVLSLVEKYQAELLPTSPTFINLLLLSEAYKRHEIASLKMVTYGTEPMLESTLRRFHQLLPHIRLHQTYGLSEVGILRSQSESSNSLWVRVGGEGYDVRIVDGVLQIKAKSAMLGYLNAPSPFTPDGWLDTGDLVEVNGEYIRFLGRRSEIINVGGEKVYPAEVENVIQEIDNVAEVTVYGEPNPILGNIVCAKITLLRPEDPRTFSGRVKAHCASRCERYKVPVRILIASENQHGARFKKTRRVTDDPGRNYS